MPSESADHPCPSCGGSGGGPFGPAGSAWDDDTYVCPRCKGRGVLVGVDREAAPRPGVAKASAPAAAEKGHRKSHAG